MTTQGVDDETDDETVDEVDVTDRAAVSSPRPVLRTRTVAAVLACDALAAYKAVSDVVATADYSDEVQTVAWTVQSCPGLVTVGDTFAALNLAGSSTWTSHSEVTEADPGHRFAFRVGTTTHPVAFWTFDLQAVHTHGRGDTTACPTTAKCTSVDNRLLETTHVENTRIQYTVEFPSAHTDRHDRPDTKASPVAERRLDQLAINMTRFLDALHRKLSSDSCDSATTRRTRPIDNAAEVGNTSATTTPSTTTSGADRRTTPVSTDERPLLLEGPHD